MYSQSICRDTSIGQSCSYEQESKATVFQKLFSLKAHLYILEGYPQALSQNQYIFLCYDLFDQIWLSHFPGQNRLKAEMLLAIRQGGKTAKGKMEKP